MRKIYRYEDLSYTADKGKKIVFRIDFVSDGNTGNTFINIPGNEDKEIADAGKITLGKIEELTSETTVSVSDIANPIPEEDEVIIDFYINDKLIVHHKNLKNEADRPYIILNIKFTES